MPLELGFGRKRWNPALYMIALYLNCTQQSRSEKEL